MTKLDKQAEDKKERKKDGNDDSSCDLTDDGSNTDHQCNDREETTKRNQNVLSSSDNRQYNTNNQLHPVRPNQASTYNRDVHNFKMVQDTSPHVHANNIKNRSLHQRQALNPWEPSSSLYNVSQSTSCRNRATAIDPSHDSNTYICTIDDVRRALQTKMIQEKMISSNPAPSMHHQIRGFTRVQNIQPQHLYANDKQNKTLGQNQMTNLRELLSTSDSIKHLYVKDYQNKTLGQNQMTNLRELPSTADSIQHLYVKDNQNMPLGQNQMTNLRELPSTSDSIQHLHVKDNQNKKLGQYQMTNLREPPSTADSIKHMYVKDNQSMTLGQNQMTNLRELSTTSDSIQHLYVKDNQNKTLGQNQMTNLRELASTSDGIQHLNVKDNQNKTHGQNQMTNLRELPSTSDSILALMQLNQSIHSKNENPWSLRKASDCILNKIYNRNQAINPLDRPATLNKPFQDQFRTRPSQYTNRETTGAPVYVSTTDAVQRSKELVQKSMDTGQISMESVQKPMNPVQISKESVTGHDKVHKSTSVAEEIRNPEENITRPTIHQTTSEKQPKLTIRTKHLYNVKVILNCTNATFIRSQEDIFYTCFFCEKYYQNPSDLKEHNLNEHTNLEECNFYMKQFYVSKLDITGLRCKICNGQINTLDPLFNHLNVHHSKNLFMDVKNQILPVRFYENQPQCYVCSQLFSNLRSMSFHVQRHYSKHVCSVCNVGFFRKEIFLKHQWTHVNEDLMCRFCPKQFDEKDLRDKHEKASHYDSTMRTCDYCDEKFNYTREKLLHVLLVHKNKVLNKSHTHEDVYQPKNTPSGDLRHTASNSQKEGNASKFVHEVPTVHTVPTYTGSIDLMDNEDVETYSQTADKAVQTRKRHKKKDIQLTDNLIERTNDIIIDLTDVCNEPINSSVEYRKNTIGPKNNSMEPKTTTTNPINKCVIGKVKTPTNDSDEPINRFTERTNFDVETETNDFNSDNEYPSSEEFMSESDSFLSTKQCSVATHQVETEINNEVENDGPIIKNVFQYKEEHSEEEKVETTDHNDQNIIKNVEVDKHIEQNLDKDIEVTDDKDSNELTIKDKHIYNILAILENTNATLIEASDDIVCACYFCDKVYENPSDLKEHAINTHCNIKKTHFVNIYVADYIAKLDITGLYCKLCNDTPDSLEAIISHLNEVHKKNLFVDLKNKILPFRYNDGVLVCCVCLLIFKCFRTLWIHLQQPHYRNYDCKLCDSGFVTLVKLRSHERVVHNMGSFKFFCELCPMKFKSKTNMRRHIKKVHKSSMQAIKLYKCDFCHESFNHMQLKEQHMLRVHNVRSENASENSEVNLETSNIDIDTSKKCHACDMVFMTSDALSVHVKRCSSFENSFVDKEVIVESGEKVVAMTDVPPKHRAELLNKEETKTADKLIVVDKNKNAQTTDILTEQIECIDLTSDCVEPVNSCVEHQNDSVNLRNEIVDITSDQSTLDELPFHRKQYIASSIAHFSGNDKAKRKDIPVRDISQEMKVDGKLIAKEQQRDTSYFTSPLNIYNMSEKDKDIHNLKIVLQCTNATLIGSSGDDGYKCFFCDNFYQNPLDLKEHSMCHKHVINAYIDRGNIIGTTFSGKLDITDLYCKLCCRKMETFNNILNHLYTVHKKNIFNIQSIIQVIKFNAAMLKFCGKMIQKSQDTFKCCFCNESFEHLSLKDVHILKAHGAEATNTYVKPIDKSVEPIIKVNGLIDEYVKSANTNVKITDVGNKCHSYDLSMSRNVSLVLNKEYNNSALQGPNGKAEIIIDVNTGGLTSGNTYMNNYKKGHITEESGDITVDCDHSLNNVEMIEIKEHNVHKNFPMAQNIEQILDKKLYSQKNGSILTSKDKYIYNIKTILEYTNASLVQPREYINCTCYFCDMYFNNPADLKKHALNAHMIVKNTNFINLSAEYHIPKLDITGLYCKLCNIDIDSLENVIVHLNKVHNKNIFVDIKNQIILPFKFNDDLLICGVCPKSFNTFWALFIHLDSHYKHFICKKCNCGFMTLLQLKTHEINTCTSNVPSEYCAKQFNTVVDMKGPLKEVDDTVEMYKCSMCNKSFKDIMSKELHITKDHNVRSGDINTETIKNTVESANKQDELTNISVETNQTCLACNMMFLTRDALNAHVNECASLPNRLSVHIPETTIKTEAEEVQDHKCSLADDPHKTNDQYNDEEVIAIKMENPPLSGAHSNPLSTLHQNDFSKKMGITAVPLKPLQPPSISNDPIRARKSFAILDEKLDHRLEEDKVPFTATTDNVRRVSNTEEDGVNKDIQLENTTFRDYGSHESFDCSKDTLKDKRLYNVTVILNCTNATLVRSHDDTGYRCHFCDECFPNSSELKQHSLQVHTDIKESHFANTSDCVVNMDITGLRCKICDKAIYSFESLIDHLNSIHGKNLYTDIDNQILPLRFNNNMPECSVCFKSFNNLQTLSDHMTSHYKNFVCDICNIGFMSRIRLLAHKKNHSVSEYPCQLCGKQFETKRKRQNHQRIVHYFLFAHKCGYCGERFRYLRQKESHLKWVHQIAVNEENTSNDAPNLDLQQTGHEVEMQRLSYHDKYFVNVNLLLICTNVTLIHSQEDFGYTCYFCDKFFEAPSDLKEHALETHTNIPKTQIYKSFHMRNIIQLDITDLCCKLCDDTFDTIENVTQHLEAIHKKIFCFDTKNRIMPIRFNDGTPLCCYCMEEFNNCSSLVNHLRDHYRNYICDACDSGFINKKQLIYHIRSNDALHGNFKCNFCSERFNTYIMQEEHENMVHSKIYPCIYCKKVFKSRQGEKRHRKTFHKDKFQNKCVNSTNTSSVNANSINDSVNPTNTSSVKNCINPTNSSSLNDSANLPNTSSVNDCVTPTNRCIEASSKSEITEKIVIIPEDTSITKCTDSVLKVSDELEVNNKNSNKKPIIEIVLKYNEEEQSLQNSIQNIKLEPPNISMEISQKCQACDMVFITWDAMSVHIKECTHFANLFLGEDDEMNKETIENSDIESSVKEDENIVEFKNSLMSKNYVLKKDKHFYNLKIILECTNATIFKERQGEYACYFCDNFYINPADLKKHNNTTHTTVNRKDFKFPIGNARIVAHLDTTDLMCKLCNTAISNLQELTTHLNEEHQKELYSDIMNQLLAFKLYDHMNTTKGKHYNFTCELCHKEFASKESLRVHVKTHTELTIISCGFCNESFRTAKQRDLHLKFAHNVKHTNECHLTKPNVTATNECNNPTIKCVKPTNTFVKTTDECVNPTNSNVKRRNKNTERVHQCTVCDKMFFTPRAMRYHYERMHLKQKKHFCPICNKGFYFICELKLHMSTHTKVPAFKCEICNNTYMRKNYYAEHMRIHANERPYKCDICNKTFVASRSLRLHEQTAKHNNKK